MSLGRVAGRPVELLSSARVLGPAIERLTAWMARSGWRRAGAWLAVYVGAGAARRTRADRNASLEQGGEVCVSFADFSGRYLYFHGSMEPTVERFFQESLKPDSIVLDIGANVGLYTAIASRHLGAQGAVHAFEPDPETARRLRLTAALNKPRAPVLINELAVSDCDDSEVTLWTSETAADKGLASLVKEHRWGSFSRGVSVSTITVDTYVRQHQLPRVDLMKCDVEGSEWDVLTGAEATLRDNDVLVIAELASDAPHSPAEICLLMESFGYSAEALDVPTFAGDWEAFEFGNVAFSKHRRASRGAGLEPAEGGV